MWYEECARCPATRIELALVVVRAWCVPETALPSPSHTVRVLSRASLPRPAETIAGLRPVSESRNDRRDPMKIREVMVKEVVTIEPSSTLVDAAKRMRDANVGVLPIVEGERVRGVITDRDIVVRGIATGRDPSTTRVTECATPEVVSARPDWEVEDARRMMAKEHVGRLPVVDESGHVVGMVTLSSLALRSREEKEALDTAKEVARRSAKAA